LNFKVDEISKIEEQTGGKFIPKDEYDKYMKWKSQQEIEEEKDQQEVWEPEIQPDDIEVDIQEVEPQLNTTPDLRNQANSETKDSLDKDESPENGISCNDSDHGGNEENAQKTDPKKNKEIGNWGERFVLGTLARQFSKEGEYSKTASGGKCELSSGQIVDIRWMNCGGDVGKGYDFVLLHDGTETEYIEVKSKVGSAEELITITGTQWEFARKLEDEGDGEKYSIYVVSKAGTSTAAIHKIKNPIKLWKEGRLYAHPVNFRV